MARRRRSRTNTAERGENAIVTSDDDESDSSNSSNDNGNEESTENKQPSPSRKRRRRSARAKNSSIAELAKELVTNKKKAVFITGAGLSVASGIRPFRGKSHLKSEALWTQHIWTNATRETFRKDPLGWYNDFWLPCLSLPQNVQPNAGHKAVHWLLDQTTSGGAEALKIKMITQNVDGLLPPNRNHTIEAHGRLGLYKCIPDEDSDTDSESDEDDDRLVHLGHRRKESKRKIAHKRGKRSCKNRSHYCPYQHEQSVTVVQIEPQEIQGNLKQGKGPLSEAPKCPHCSNILAPQALLFDEGYHSHDFYEFRKMEEWLADAEVIVFIGTSFAVRLPEVTLEHARARKIPVYNFNAYDLLKPTSILDAYNIKGRAEETLPLLVQEVAELQRNSNVRRSSNRIRQREICA